MTGGTALADRRINIVQGQELVSRDPGVVLTTLLGSCVAACLHDPSAGVGGMNHFLLPGESASERHGVHAMELLVNALLRAGARRERLQAKLFGGARMVRGLTDVGELNAAFAERFLQHEGIAHVGGSLRGEQGRRVQFWPVGGRVRQALMAPADASAFRAERYVPEPSPVDAGALELF